MLLARVGLGGFVKGEVYGGNVLVLPIYLWRGGYLVGVGVQY